MLGETLSNDEVQSIMQIIKAIKQDLFIALSNVSSIDSMNVVRHVHDELIKRFNHPTKRSILMIQVGTQFLLAPHTRV